MLDIILWDSYTFLLHLFNKISNRHRVTGSSLGDKSGDHGSLCRVMISLRLRQNAVKLQCLGLLCCNKPLAILFMNSITNVLVWSIILRYHFPIRAIRDNNKGNI
ncbi:hypothetical protein CEXT_353331 [Caerostris extrusa]|uniref:Uncharacterized protein n=1 Tax=Caerostris extrusa TaxID=172846 RepID=A0AAV4RK96_CAEEX|nr:hypothetical protein CEXT_353331 [Caerostris extrusa]